MLKRALRVALTIVVAATHSSWACAQSEIKTHIMDELTVQKLATSLDHASMVEFPEVVTAAVVGTEGVKMEFRDNVVILEPQKAGVQTNLLVWAAGKQLVYEIQPASETSEWPFVIRETFAPAPPVATKSNLSRGYGTARFLTWRVSAFYAKHHGMQGNAERKGRPYVGCAGRRG